MFSVLAMVLQAVCLIGAIGKTTAFPKPLEKEEEERLITRWMDGDEEAKEKLILHNLRLVAHIAKKYERNQMDREDVISCGTIGLIKAVTTFERSKGSLSNYASRCIENEIRMALRIDRKLVQTVSLSEPIGSDKEGNELSLADLVCTEDDSMIEEVQTKLEAERVERVMRHVLSKREQTVLRLRFGMDGGEPMAQREVALLLGISRSYVSRIEKKAIGKMREALLEGERA